MHIFYSIKCKTFGWSHAGLKPGKEAELEKEKDGNAKKKDSSDILGIGKKRSGILARDIVHWKPVYFIDKFDPKKTIAVTPPVLHLYIKDQILYFKTMHRKWYKMDVSEQVKEEVVE